MAQCDNRFCPHCGFEVSARTYFRHKSLYYSDGQWHSNTGEDITRLYDMNERKEMVKYCSHCKLFVNIRTYYRHRNLIKEQKSGSVEIDGATEQGCCTSSEDDVPEQGNVLVWSSESQGRKKQRIFIENFVGNEEVQSETDANDCVLDQLNDLWEDLSLSDIKNDICSDADYLEETCSNSKKAIDLVHWIVVFVSVWASYFNISDNAMYYLLHFLKALFTVCGYSVPLFAIIASLFPATLYSLYKIQGTKKDHFLKYVSCPACYCTYRYEECIELKNGKKQSKKCSFIRFPNHSHRNQRKPCGAVLLKEITLKGNNTILYPRKSFCFNSLEKSLQLLIDRPGFEANCESWRDRVCVPGTYRDIYDGRMWKNFEVYNNDSQNPREFLKLPRHYALLMNLDWFQPFKHSPYSVGVIYMVVLNLSREERFKQENVILVGVIPGPKEPNGEEMRHFIKPLVDELEKLWNTGMDYKGKKYFAVLLGCACDLPAGRKLCGLLSFSARIGCSKCTKEFNTKKFGEKANYGGFDQHHKKRNYNEIRTQAERAKQAKTQSQRQLIEKTAGCRWSELMRLPYFNAVDMCIIDPMHSLYLGAAKYMLKNIWPEYCNLTLDKMETIQHVVDSSQLPSEVGRIPHKIASNLSSFTSDQLKNWTMYFSLYSMKPHLPKKGYIVWLHFVEACWLFSRPVITVREISKAHEHLMAFLKGFESWLDSSLTTPNFHMISHLAEQILDYGSFYGYWCFPFERYNGIQGNFHSNQKSVEIQLMRKFLRASSLSNLSLPREYEKEFGELVNFSCKQEGSLLIEVLKSVPVPRLQKLLELSNGSINPLDIASEYFLDESLYQTNGAGVYGFAESSVHIEYLHTAVEAFLGAVHQDTISGAFMKYSALSYLGEKYGSAEGTMRRNCFVLVNSWLGIDGNINCSSGEDRPAEILYFIKMYIRINSVQKQVVLAFVKWFQKHSSQSMYNTDLAKVYAKSIYEIDGPSSFVPIQKIKSKFISGFTKVNGESVRVIIPKSPKIYW